MNIRHEKVYEQLAAIAPTVMIDDDISYVNWRGRFKQLGQWFDKEAAVEKWLADYDAKAAELAAKIRDMIGDETFAVLEANSVHFGSYYIYRSGGPGEHRAGPAGAGHSISVINIPRQSRGYFICGQSPLFLADTSNV